MGHGPPSLTQLAEAHARNLTPLAAADLAHRLNLPAEVLGLMPLLGFNPAENCWTFPEFDATGLLLGLVRRFPDGSKRAVAGSSRGLSLVAGWADCTGPLFLVEGPTDALAMSACGLAAIGRPSNLGGVTLLAELLPLVDAARPIVVVGENDRKPNGLWPGKDGAKRVAEELAVKLQRNVLCTLPPEGYKDVRAWVADRWQPGSAAVPAASAPPRSEFDEADQPSGRDGRAPREEAAILQSFNWTRLGQTEKFWVSGGAESMLQVRAAILSEDGRAERYAKRPRPRGRAVGGHRLGRKRK